MWEFDFGNEDMWENMIMHTSVHESMHTDGFVPVLESFLMQTAQMLMQIHTLDVILHEWVCGPECSHDQQHA